MNKKNKKQFSPKLRHISQANEDAKWDRDRHTVSVMFEQCDS